MLTPDTDAADTLRFTCRDLDTEAPTEAPTDPDGTAFYDLTPAPARHVGIERASRARRRLIRAARHDVAGLRDAIADGWDVGPELAHEERRLAALLSADRR